MVTEEQIEKVLNNKSSIEEQVEKLIKKSNMRGGTDNISIAYLKRRVVIYNAIKGTKN